MNEIAEQFTIIGIHTLRTYNTTSAEAQELELQMEEHARKWPLCKTLVEQAEHYVTYRNIFDKLQKFKTGERVIHNIVVTSGRSTIAQRLANTTTYTGIINYGALGSSSTTPTNADTHLGTEVFRKIVSSASFTANVAFIDFFYSKADTNGTYNEFGTFIDGTASSGTGQMFTHALTGGWTKSSSESMTVSVTYTIS